MSTKGARGKAVGRHGWSGAGGDGREGERNKHLHHKMSNDLWSHIFYLPCSPMVFCPAEPLGSTGTPLPASMQPRETASTEETLFLGVGGPGRTWDWKLMHLKATYGFIMTFPNTLSISLGPNIWHSRAG